MYLYIKTFFVLTLFHVIEGCGFEIMFQWRLWF